MGDSRSVFDYCWVVVVLVPVVVVRSAAGGAVFSLRELVEVSPFGELLEELELELVPLASLE